METKIYRLQRQIARERELKISNTQSSKLADILAAQARQKHALILAKHRIIWNESYLYFADKVQQLERQLSSELKSINPPNELNAPNEFDSLNELIEASLDFSNVLLKATKNTPQMQQTLTELVQDHEMETVKLNTIVKQLESEINACCNVKFNIENISNPWIVGKSGDIFRLEYFLQDHYIISRHLLIKETYYNQMDLLTATYHDVLGSKFDNWPEEEHKIFCKIMDEHKRPNCRHLLLERQKLELGKSSKELTKHFTWCHRAKTYQKHKEAIEILAANRMQEFADFAVSYVDSCRQLELQEAQFIHNMQFQVQKMEDAHSKIQKWRVEKRAKLLEQEAEREKQKQLKDMEIEKNLQEQIEYQQMQKRKLEQYNLERQRLLSEQQQVAAQIALKINAEKVLMRKINDERVLFRRNKLDEKLKARQAELDKITQQKVLLEKRLADLKSNVAVNIEADWDRIFGETISFANYKSAEAQKANWFNVKSGFSSDAIIKDERTKLALAFEKQGLMGSSYARSKILQIPAKINPEQKTAIKLG